MDPACLAAAAFFLFAKKLRMSVTRSVMARQRVWWMKRAGGLRKVVTAAVVRRATRGASRRREAIFRRRAFKARRGAGEIGK